MLISNFFLDKNDKKIDKKLKPDKKKSSEQSKKFLIVEEKAVFDFRNWLFIATLAKFRQFLKEFRALLVNKTECEV